MRITTFLFLSCLTFNVYADSYSLLDAQYASMGTINSLLAQLQPVVTAEEKRQIFSWSTNVVEKNHRAMGDELVNLWIRLGVTFTDEEKISLTRWVESQISKHQSLLPCYPYMLSKIGACFSEVEKQKSVAWIFGLDLSNTVDDYGNDASLSYFNVVYESLVCLGATMTQEMKDGLLERMKFLSERHPSHMADLMKSAIGGWSMSNAEKLELLSWAESFYEKHVDEFRSYEDVLLFLSPSLSESEKRYHLVWAMNMTTNVLSRKAEIGSDSIEVNVSSTNVVLHYVKQQQECTVDPIPSDSAFVAIVTEIDGNATGIPNSWATNFPSFTEKFGGDFIKAVTKPTGKIGNGNVPLMVWQDYVAGTDPTDVSSRFSASINYVDGHVEINWTPVVADRSYKVYGKKKLIDEEWLECSKDAYDDYNFFKVKVSCKKD